MLFLNVLNRNVAFSLSRMDCVCVSGPDWYIPVPDTGRLDSSAHIARAQLAQKSKRHPPSRDKLRESFRKQVGDGAVKMTFSFLLLTVKLTHTHTHTHTHTGVLVLLSGRRRSETPGEPLAVCSHSGPAEQQKWPVQHLVPLHLQPSTSHQPRLHPTHLHQQHSYSVTLTILIRIQKVQKEISRLQVQGLRLYPMSFFFFVFFKDSATVKFCLFATVAD